MKLRTLMAASCLLFLAGTVQAQNFSEAKRSMSQGEQPSFLIDLQIGNTDVVEDLWQDYLKDFDARKPKQNRSGEYFADNAEIESISNNTIDVFATIEGKGKAEGVLLTVWFNLGGAYLSSEQHPERMEAARIWLQGFETLVLRSYAEEALEAEEDQLDDMEDELKDLRKEREDAEEEVEDLREALEEAKALEEQKAQAVEAKAEEVELQREVVKRSKKKVESLKN